MCATLDWSANSTVVRAYRKMRHWENRTLGPPPAANTHDRGWKRHDPRVIHFDAEVYLGAVTKA